MKKISILAALALGAALIFSGCDTDAVTEAISELTDSTTDDTTTDDTADETTTDETGDENADEEVEEVTYTLEAAWEITLDNSNVTTDDASGCKLQLYSTELKDSPFDLTITEIAMTYDGSEVTLASPFVVGEKLSMAQTDDAGAVQLIEALTANGIAMEAGKVVTLTIKGTTSVDITAATSILAGIVDNSQAAGWWTVLGQAETTSIAVN